MSVWKFWNHQKSKVSKTKSETSKDSINHQDPAIEELEELGEFSSDSSPTFERHKNRHQMSVSRSGRYKQKLKKRSGILTHPELLESGLLRSHQANSGGIERQNSGECQSLCEEENLYGFQRFAREHYIKNKRKEEFKLETPRICDMQKRSEVRVVAI